MNKLGLRFSNFAFSLLATVVILIGSVPLVPTAYGITVNTGINQAGVWHRAGPGVVFNETTEPGEHVYIVRHQAPSLAQYKGDIPGLAATSPAATGAARLDVDSAASQAYLSYLAELHSNLETAIEVQIGKSVDVIHRYDAVFNGIALRLNSADARAVSTLAGVRSITRDYTRALQTDNGPHWIGADEIWGEGDGQLPSGNAPCVGNCGEGVVAGIIDTGVNAKHPSFADVGGDGYDHQAPAGMLNYKGACSAQVVGTPGLCNDKLIGYYDFTGTSPEDDHGHGSHTASTTAGNVLYIDLEAPTITVSRTISGVAPHANIISYKGCSGTPVGCVISALIASINAATLDEVDVINYSIGGASSNPWADLDAQAFFDAYKAGIFVATSASNDGPGFGTLGSPADAPWVTSVGASTHDRKLANGIVNMTNADATPGIADIFGASLTSPSPQAEVVYAGDYASDSSDPANAHLCGSGAGDPATGEGSGGNPFPDGLFAGKIVVCDRGEYGRVHKSENVFEAGAVGYVLANDSANGDSLVGDAYPLPGVHISFDNGVILKQWIADNGAKDHKGTAMINGSNPDSDPKFADIMASFSSRGANPAAPSLIKPDVTAPGVDILAAWMASPEVTVQDVVLEAAGVVQDQNGETYGVISGTSMSSPHTAGAGALIRGVHPDWSPDEVKSALMTTAFVAPPGNGPETHPVYKEDGVTPADPFDMGSGRVDLHVAANAGFVLDETIANYENANPGAGGDVTTLNIASLGNEDCGTFSIDGTCSWERTIQSTAASTVTWTLTSTGSAGMTISAAPNLVTLDPGESATITFTADVSNSPKHEWIFGEVQFTPSVNSVPPAHFPVAVIPKPPGGGGAGLELKLHGNGHDLCDDGATAYTGRGEADVVSAAGCVPFLSTDDLDDVNEAATWGPLQPGLNGPAFDPKWVWTLTEDVRLAGNMVVDLWASQVTTDTGVLFDTNIDVTLTVDGTVHVLDHRTAHIFTTPGQPQRLRMVVPVPDITATSTVELMIEPVFVDTGNTVTFYYDSTQPCSVSGEGSCDSKVSMPAISGPLAPVANDDFAAIGNGESVTIDVLANDFDPEGGPLAVQIVSEPVNGSADITLSNAIVYTHNGSNTSNDAIVYRITDNDGLTADATVNIAIAGACTSAPDYLDDFESGAPGWTVDTETLIGASFPWALNPNTLAPEFLTSYQTDAFAQDPVDSSDVSKDDRLVSPEFLVSGQTVLSFWHRYITEAGFDGGVLEIRASDDNGATWGAWEDITDNGSFITGGYNSTLAGPARAGWSGETDGLEMSEVQVNLAAFASQTIQVRFRMLQDVLLGTGAPLVGGWFVDDVALNNLYSECNETQGPNAVNDAATVDAGQSVTTDVKANDSDPDTAHADLVVDAIVTAPQHGTATIVGTDSVEYSHNGNTATSDFYEYRVKDQDGNFAVAGVTITINQPENADPVAKNDTATVNAGQTVTIDVKANDSDVNHSNAELDVSIETQPASGAAAVNADGTVSYTHNNDASTTDSFQYRVTDPAGAFDIATVSISIVPNMAPTAVDDYATVAAGESVTTNVKANDTDPDSPHASLTVTEIVTQPMHGTVAIVGTDSVTYTHDGQFDINDSYEYRVEDPDGLSDTAWVNIDITQDRCVPPPSNNADSDSDDDDFDNDCQRDDIDSDDDNDGQDDDYDNDDDNDGDSDDSDSDDDNDGIDDEFDQPSTKENQTRTSSQSAANSDDTHSTSVAPNTLLLIAVVDTALNDSLTVELRDPSGTLVGTAVSIAGRALVTTVPAVSGNYTVKVLNKKSTPVDYQLRMISRVEWP